MRSIDLLGGNAISGSDLSEPEVSALMDCQVTADVAADVVDDVEVSKKKSNVAEIIAEQAEDVLEKVRRAVSAIDDSYALALEWGPPARPALFQIRFSR